MRAAVMWLKLRLRKQEHGQDIVEYAMLMALIAIMAMVAIGWLGSMITETMYNGFIVGHFNFLQSP